MPIISHRDKYDTYAVVTCEIKLFWNYFSVWFHM